MDELLSRHHAAIVKRGQITEKTTITDFLEKIGEEDEEMWEQAERSMNNDENNLAQETVDSIMVRVHMLKKLGFDFKEELEKNTIYQETRND